MPCPEMCLKPRTAGHQINLLGTKDSARTPGWVLGQMAVSNSHSTEEPCESQLPWLCCGGRRWGRDGGWS